LLFAPIDLNGAKSFCHIDLALLEYACLDR
jgi:hypothetical protein